MRLISTLDLKLHSFPDNAIPKYSILSHTWGKEGDEVLYHEMLNTTDEVRHRPGYRKIAKCAEISRQRGCEYTWVDTCCIDKTSSAELSESINSMFAWYRKSAVCLVHLEDFHGEHFRDVTRENRWFTRGWTLQELLAPPQVEFHSSTWKFLGKKGSNIRKLKSITSIDSEALKDGNMEDWSIAEKMRWLAARTTTKVEDMAYCMLGIFDVNIPLIYGEGSKAFRRLQEEIMRTSDDASILLWNESTRNPFAYRGSLARSPSEFVAADWRHPGPKQALCVLDEPFSVTNKGLRVTESLIGVEKVLPHLQKDDPGAQDLLLDFHPESLFCLFLESQGVDEGTFFILLRRLHANKHHYARAYPGYPFSISSHLAQEIREKYSGQVESFFLTERLPLSDSDVKLACQRFDFRLEPHRPWNCRQEAVIPSSHSTTEPHILEAVHIVRWSRTYPYVGTPLDFCMVLRYDERSNVIHILFLREDALNHLRQAGNVSVGGFIDLEKHAQWKSFLLDDEIKTNIYSENFFFPKIEGDKFEINVKRMYSTGVYIDITMYHIEHLRVSL